jgi:hypothetical protein
VNYLIISNKIDAPSYNYNIVMPLGISVVGTVPNASDSQPINVNIQLSDIFLLIYYNSGLVKRVSSTNVSTFDISLNVPQNTGSVPNPFSVNAFIGNVAFSNIQLNTSPTYVYTFAFTANMTVVPSNTSVFQYIAAVANITPSSYTSTGCTILNPTSAINNGSSITASTV